MLGCCRARLAASLGVCLLLAACGGGGTVPPTGGSGGNAGTSGAAGSGAAGHGNAGVGGGGATGIGGSGAGGAAGKGGGGIGGLAGLGGAASSGSGGMGGANECTPPSTELLHAAYPHAFVSNATCQPVRLNGFNLRATGMNGWAMAESHFLEIHAKGFNMMRLAMSWNDFEPTQGQFDASVLAALDLTIQRCKSAGLYVIIDPIHANTGPRLPPWAVQSGDDDFATVLRSGLPYLKMLAARYADEPQVVALDLLNEPHMPGIDSARLFNGYTALINAVRPIVPNKILVVEPIAGDVDPTKLDFSLLTDKSNIVWSPHFYYAGGDDDGYSASGWASAGSYVWDGTSGYPVRNVAALDAHFMVMLNLMRSVHLPVWIGEYGIGSGVQNHDPWLEDVVSLLEAHDLSRTQWEYHWGQLAAVDDSYNFFSWVPLLTK